MTTAHTHPGFIEQNSSQRLILLNPMLQRTNSTPDGQAIQAYLQKLVSTELIFENIKLIWIKNNPLEGLRLLYKAESRGSQSDPFYFFARTLSSSQGKKWQEKINRQFILDIEENRILKVFQKAAVYSSKFGLLFQIFPADRRLPFLVNATDPKFMKSILEKHFSVEGERKLAKVDVSVVQYKPERKCLIRYQLHWQSSKKAPSATQIVYGKVFRKVKRVYENLEKIHQTWYSSVFQIPEPLAMVPDLRLELLSSVPGVHLSYMCNKKIFPKICRRVAQGLLEFHETPVLLNETRDLPEELLELKCWGENFIQSSPDNAHRLRKLIFTLEMKLLGHNKIKPTLVHGDFHVANILVDDEHLSLLDFENCFMGNPAIDVGAFYAQLKLLSLKIYQKQSALDCGVRSFMKTYMHKCSPELQTIILTYSALSCLWCAYFQCILRPVKKGWLDRAHAMIELCEQILETETL
ncbi:MAG: phosphotransferase family protein [bacterium]